MIQWKKYDLENPPQFRKKFLVIDYEEQILTANLFNTEKFGIGWWESNGRGYIGGVTHYAEINLPGEVDHE